MKGRQRFWKQIGKILLFPHISIIICLSPISAVLLVLAFTRFSSDDALSILSYALSAYTLSVICARIPRMLRFAKKQKAENKLIQKYASDMQFRVKISLFIGIILNLSYAIFQLCLGLWHRSLWYFSFSAYYVCLALMRLLLAKHNRKFTLRQSLANEYKRSRMCGILLMFLSLALAVIIGYIISKGKTFNHHEITTIAMAAYTFTSLTLAIINLLKYRKYQSPVLTMAKLISLSAALVSMLTLEATMLSTFGEKEDQGFDFIITGISGGVVLGFVIVTAILIVIKANVELKRIKGAENGE